VKQIDIIIPSYKSEVLTTLAIQSFERFKGDFSFRYIVVENAQDESYKEPVLALAENVVWISRQQASGYCRASANAEAIEAGLKHVESELVFICHNDVVACHDSWMDILYKKIQEGCHIAGTVLDNVRIKAVHISGMLLTTELAKEVSCYPINRKNSIVYEGLSYEEVSQLNINATKKALNIPNDAHLDVGDTYTQYCRENNLDYFCLENTENKNVSVDMSEPYASFPVDRAVDADGQVVFMHLGRGIAKKDNNYSRTGRVSFSEWEKFVKKNVLGEK